jgi:CheY-like chemotaxis protein
VARRLRKSASGNQLTLVAITGWGQAEDKRLAEAAGFDHHLTKPVDFEALLLILAKARPGAADSDDLSA